MMLKQILTVLGADSPGDPKIQKHMMAASIASVICAVFSFAEAHYAGPLSIAWIGVGLLVAACLFGIIAWCSGPRHEHHG